MAKKRPGSEAAEREWTKSSHTSIYATMGQVDFSMGRDKNYNPFAPGGNQYSPEVGGRAIAARKARDWAWGFNFAKKHETPSRLRTRLRLTRQLRDPERRVGLRRKKM
jgi:hypothetical protein